MTQRIYLPVFLVMGLCVSAQGALTWDSADATNPLHWSTSASNWTSDGGATHQAWTQSEDAIFDGEPSGKVEFSGGGVEVNSLAVLNIADNSMTIDRISGNDADYMRLVGDAQIDVEAGTILRLPRVNGGSGLVLTGGGRLTTTRGFSYSGTTWVKNGSLESQPVNSALIRLLENGTANDAGYKVQSNGSTTFAQNFETVAGSTGTASIQASRSTGSTQLTYDWTGDFVLGSDLHLNPAGNGGQGNLWNMTGDFSGDGGLTLKVRNTNDDWVFSGNHTHAGPIVFDGSSSRNDINLTLDGNFAHSNIDASDGHNLTIDGAGTLAYNVDGATADLIQLGNGALLDLSGLTLAPMVVAPTLTEYVIVNTTSGVDGTFLDTGGYQVDYDGTDANPNAVVLIVPEPASIALLALGGLAMRRRRR